MKRKLKIYKGYLIILILMCSFLLPCKSVNAEAFPTPTNLKYVNDYAGILDNNTKEYIVSVGKELEDKTGAQAVVVTIKSLEGKEVKSYATELFRNWGIGQKDKNNGLLILLSMEEKRWAVEVGRGLEGAIPDILSNRVMEEVAIPHFKKNDFNTGLRNSYSVFSDHIGQEYGVTLDKSEKIEFNYNQAEEDKGSTLFLYVVLGFIFLDAIFNKGRVMRFIIQLMFWNSFFGGGRGGRGGGGFGGGNGGGFGGFGGGDSGGGGSSGGW